MTDFFDYNGETVRFAVLNYESGTVDVFNVDKNIIDDYCSIYSYDSGVETYLQSRGYNLDEIEYMTNVTKVNVEF